MPEAWAITTLHMWTHRKDTCPGTERMQTQALADKSEALLSGAHEDLLLVAPSGSSEWLDD